MSMPSERPIAPTERTARPSGNSALARFFGGPPLSVIFRLILLSIIIGVILEVLGLDPLHIIDSLRSLFLRLAMALSAARCRHRRSHLADRSPHPRRQGTVNRRA
jgi:hypothetical protein